MFFWKIKQQVKRSYSLLEAELSHMAGNNS